MALTESEPIALGTRAPDFELPGIDGKTFSLDSFSGANGLVVMFICNHCPYVIAVEDRLVELGRSFIPQGVAFVAIMPNDVERYPDDAPDKMKQRSDEKGYPFPYLYDESQATARAYGAVCTPDIYVFDADLELAYHGRIDDNWKEPAAVTKRELAAAIEAIVGGEKPSQEQNPTIGCSIKWKTS